MEEYIFLLRWLGGCIELGVEFDPNVLSILNEGVGVFLEEVGWFSKTVPLGVSKRGIKVYWVR